MPAKQPTPTLNELFGIVDSEFDRAIHRPNILAYGQKDYPEQLAFHKCDKRGRYIAGGNRGGKTSAEVVEAIWWASDTHPYRERPEGWGTGTSPASLRRRRHLQGRRADHPAGDEALDSLQLSH
jgi:hypothetical protein